MSEKVKAAEQIATRFMGDRYRADGGMTYTLGHGLRVMRLCGRIADSPELAGAQIDRESMFIAAIFHDVGRELDFENHCESGGEFVAKELAGVLDGAQLEKTASMVKFHNRPVNVETQIIHDADLIDRIGANFVWRAIHHSAHHRQDPRSTLEWYERDKDQWESDYEDWAIFQIAKREIRRRIDFMDSFFEEMLRELACDISSRDTRENPDDKG